MVVSAKGITHPTEKDFRGHSRKIQKYTEKFLRDDFDSRDSPEMLSEVLHSANTLLNYCMQSPMESIGPLDASDSKCTPWQSVFRTD
jgi:hypothetical protein